MNNIIYTILYTMNNTEHLTIKYLINLLNNNTKIAISRHKYLIDSYPTLKINSTKSC
jgi:hypothetical protein